MLFCFFFRLVYIAVCVHTNRYWFGAQQYSTAGFPFANENELSSRQERGQGEVLQHFTPLEQRELHSVVKQNLSTDKGQ